MIATPIYTTKTSKHIATKSDTETFTLLDDLAIPYKISEYCFQVGEITETQGWILHLSVVVSQVTPLLSQMIPFLYAENIPFKFPMSEMIAEDLLIGSMGVEKIGKIINIYPPSDNIALELAKKLINLTARYKGPQVPTDVCLGGIVYTRYGGFNPVIKPNAWGSDEKFIYTPQGDLVKDIYTIPFRLLNGIIWPFDELAPPTPPEPPRLLNKIYKPISLLKADTKGNVFKGLYVKGWFNVKKCVIKQGFTNMHSDISGRDIKDRLAWQNDVHQQLSSVVPLPAIFELLEEKSYAALIMEWVDGKSLLQEVFELNPLSETWCDLKQEGKLKILNFLKEIVLMIGNIHAKGFVHRDVTPVNFLVTKSQRLVLIDLELAYSTKDRYPIPPFTLGTYGFMSPEQQESKPPTKSEDIYGIGATIILLLTGIYPVKFNPGQSIHLGKQLNFFLCDQDLSQTVANCLNPDPQLRPQTGTVLTELIRVFDNVHIDDTKIASAHNNGIPTSQYEKNIEDTIRKGLSGLGNSPIIAQNKIWYFNPTESAGPQQPINRQYEFIPSISHGAAGPLYVIAKLKESGLDTSNSHEQFMSNWRILEERYLNRPATLSPGLYHGAAGLALMISQSISAGLLPDNDCNRNYIKTCLSTECDAVDLATGIAGQGLALVRCKSFLPTDYYTTRLQEILTKIYEKRQKHGLWINESIYHITNNHAFYNIGFDDTGILWFLLAYLSSTPDSEAAALITKEISNLLINKKHAKIISKTIASREGYEIGDGGKAILATLIKTYELLDLKVCRDVTEQALLTIPSRVSNMNYSQENGLASLGELYLEAHRVFKDEKWRKRAYSIANIFLHTEFRTSEDALHWVMAQNNPPTASLFIGCSGILHFLGRFIRPTKIGYRLLG